MNETELFLQRFPSLSDLAAWIGAAPSTISSWKARNSIPRWWHNDIIEFAKSQNITLKKKDFP